jgi:hypothetical protein
MDWLGQPVPGLASSWKVSSDGRQWIFELPKVRKWSDGSDMTLAQIIASLEKSKLGTSHTQLSRLIKSVTGKDQELHIELFRPVPNLLGLLAFVDWGIFHPNSFKLKNAKWSVDATGPCSGAFCYVPSNSPVVREIRMTRNSYFALKNFESNGISDQLSIASYSTCSDLTKMKTEIIGFRSYGDDLTENCLVELREAGFEIFPPRPAWLQKLDFTQRALRTITRQQRLAIIILISNNMRSANWGTSTFPATGLRSSHHEGSLNESEFQKQLDEFAKEVGNTKLPPKLEVATVDLWSKWPTYKLAIKTLRLAGIEIVEKIYTRDEFGKLRSSGELTTAADLIYMPFGAGDPDPDTSWQYAAKNLYKGTISDREIEAAFLNNEQRSRMEMYKAFELQTLKAAVYIPLTITSDVVGIFKDFRFKNPAAIRVGIALDDYALKQER